jgi:transcriptional regulator with XRE-family HTH domain
MAATIEVGGKTYKRMADLLRGRREQLGLTQRQLGAALDMKSGDFVCLVEAGQRTFPVGQLPELARVLQIPGKDLLNFCLVEQYPELASILATSKATGRVSIRQQEEELVRSAMALPRAARRTVKTMIEQLAAAGERPETKQ